MQLKLLFSLGSARKRGICFCRNISVAGVEEESGSSLAAEKRRCIVLRQQIVS